jgi:hypothetical protein
MKIAISLKSNFAYDLMDKTFFKYNQLSEVERYSKNLKSISDLEDVFEFFKPDVVIVDTKLPNINEMSGYTKENNIPIIYFNADVDAVMEELITFFSLDEVTNEEEEVQSKEFDFIPNKDNNEVVYKDRVIEKEIIKTAYTSIPSKLIIVASMWRGAGSTTFATNLARAISNRGIQTAYIEFPISNPYMFDYLNISKGESERGQTFFDINTEIKQKVFIKKKDEVWNDRGIDWYVIDSRNEPIQSYSYEELLQLVYSINSTITIMDISSNLDHESVQNLLHHADEIFVCIEPDPIKIDWLASISKLGVEAKIQRKEKKIIDYLNEIESTENISYEFINMKYTKKIDNKVWLQCLEKKPLTFFPNLNYEDLISSVWDSKFLYDSEAYHELIEKALKPVLVKVVPRQFYQLKGDKKKGNLKKKLLSMIKKGES